MLAYGCSLTDDIRETSYIRCLHHPNKNVGSTIANWLSVVWVINEVHGFMYLYLTRLAGAGKKGLCIVLQRIHIVVLDFFFSFSIFK